MTDFLSKYRESKLPNPKEDFAEFILNQLSEQIYQEWKSKEVLNYVGTSHGHGEGFVMITLNLMSGGTENQYFYRLIEIEQPIDRAYPVTVRAFQNPPTEWKKAEDPNELRNELINIMGDPRMKIIIEMVSQMGGTIKSWSKENQSGEETKSDES